MDKTYVEMRRAVMQSTFKARDLIRSIEAQISTAGRIDEDGREVPNPHGDRLFYRVDRDLKEQVRQWIDEVAHRVRVANEDPCHETLSKLEFALSQLKAGGKKMAFEDALKWVRSRERPTRVAERH